MESGGPGGDDAPQPHHGGAPPEGAGGGGEGRVHQTGWGLAAVQHNTYALCDQESSIFVLCILIKYIYIYILKSSIFVLCILITIYSYIYIYMLNIFQIQYHSFQNYYLAIDAFRTF